MPREVPSIPSSQHIDEHTQPASNDGRLRLLAHAEPILCGGGPELFPDGHRTHCQSRIIEPMLLLWTERLPHDSNWLNELKARWHRALGIKTSGAVGLGPGTTMIHERLSSIAKALTRMPDETIVWRRGGRAASGRPSFNMLQNYDSAHANLFRYIFDLLLRGTA